MFYWVSEEVMFYWVYLAYCSTSIQALSRNTHPAERYSSQES